MAIKIDIELPELISRNYENLAEIKRAMVENIVIREYQKGNISIRESAKILGLTYEEFMTFLGERGISFINASVEEQQEDYDRLKSYFEAQEQSFCH